MAFNPFDSVRKRSKTIFAVLGIVVMLTFVLSAGAGMGQGLDFFDQVAGLFGSRGNDETLAEAYGDDITAKDLQDIRLQRTLANAFMMEALDLGYVRQAEDISNDLKDKSKISDDTRDALQRLVTLKINSRKSSKDTSEYLMYAQRLFSQQSQESMKLFMAMQKATPDSADSKALNAMTEIVMHDLNRGRREMFFRTVGIEQDKDLLDFAMMLKKADQLGIRYSPNAVDQLVESDAKGKFKVETDWNGIESRLRDRNKELTTSWLKTAIANEYRVRAVLTTMLGNTSSAGMPGFAATVSDVPGTLTPYQFYEFYKDRCSEYNFTLLELPAENFLAQVTGEPTAKEREELFKKHSAEEPDPSRERPGFKEPRKVKVEYVTLSASDKRITEGLAKLEAGKTILNAFAAATSIGGSPVTALSTFAYGQRSDEVAMKAELLDRVKSADRPYQAADSFLFMPRDHAIYKPTPIVSALGALAGVPDWGTASAAYSLLFRQVELAELKARVPMQMQAIIAPMHSTLANALGSSAFTLAHAPKPVAEGLYAKDVQENYRKQKVRDTFEMDVRQFQSKLAELNRDASPFLGKPDKTKVEKAKAESRKFIDEWVKERGLKLNGNKEPRDKYALANDPDLKVLNDLAIPDPEGTNSFSSKFYKMNDFRQFGLGMVLDVSAFRPEWFPAEPSGEGLEKPNHLVWMSDDVAPQTYNNFTNANKLTNGEMAKRVDAAWRLQKARDLAKAEAEKIAQQVRGITKTVSTDPLGVDKQLRDLALQTKTRKLEAERLALLKFSHGATDARDMTYKPSTIEKSLVTYPTADFVNQLLEMRTKALGEVIVLHDAPRSKYYIATLTAKREKTIDEFRDVFAKSSVSTGMGRNPLYGQFALGEERNKAVTEALDRLKAEAKFKETDAFKKRDKKTDEAAQ